MMVFYLLHWNEICATFETVVMADVSHCGVDQPVDLTQIWIFFIHYPPYPCYCLISGLSWHSSKLRIK